MASRLPSCLRTTTHAVALSAAAAAAAPRRLLAGKVVSRAKSSSSLSSSLAAPSTSGNARLSNSLSGNSSSSTYHLSTLRTLSTSALRVAAAPAPVAAQAETEEVDLPSSRPASTSSSPSIDPYLFKSLQGKVSRETLKAVLEKPFGYERMSDVQLNVLHLLPDVASGEAVMPDDQGRDMLVKAKTGTGKTLAFLIPAIEARLQAIKDVGAGNYTKAWKDVLKRNRPELELGDSPAETLSEKERKTIQKQFVGNTIGTLVLSPTRELATQIATEAKKLATHHRGLNVQLLVGGANRGEQIRTWKNSHPDIVVATPGRMLDLLQDVSMIREAASATQTLILDEADTLLEMGFSKEIRSILDHLPKPGEDRHTMLFSATVSSEIRQIARQSLAKNHRFIDCVPPGEENTHKHIPQYATVLPQAGMQIPYILSLIAHDQLVNAGKSKVIVFAPTTRMTQLIADAIQATKRDLPLGPGSRIFEIHSKKDQNARFRVSNGFRQDKSGGSVLVTSDVSARGVDYPGTTRVIQVGIPAGKDQYIHRIGRTGRAGASGRADLVMMPFENNFVDFELNDLPVKMLDPFTLTEDLANLAAKYDENPASVVPEAVLKELQQLSKGPTKRGRRTVGPPRNYSEVINPIRGPLSGKVSFDAYEAAVKEFMSGIEEDEIREIFISQLGFYLGRHVELRTSKRSILEGLKPWATEAGGLEHGVSISPSLAAKMGIPAERHDRGSRRGGGSFGGSGRGGGGFERGGGRGGRDSRAGGWNSTDDRYFKGRDSSSKGSRQGFGGSFRRDRSDPFAGRFGSGSRFADN